VKLVLVIQICVLLLKLCSVYYIYIENDYLFNPFLHTSVFEAAQYTWLSAHQRRQLRGNVGPGHYQQGRLRNIYSQAFDDIHYQLIGKNEQFCISFVE